MEPALQTFGITKRYGSLLANRSIDLKVERGDIHAVMGENGAGKSTLMSILYGLVRPDSGQILLDGKETVFNSPIEAIKGGLGMVHQAFKLFNSLTVWENVVFGSEPSKLGFTDRRQARDFVVNLARRYRLPVEPDARIETLSVGVRQRVEILKALYRDVRTLILDEPTAVLTPLERDGLFDVMRSLKADGRTILFVTHKLHEVMAVTDQVTVLRDGANVARMATAETTPEEIITAMTGRNVQLVVARPEVTPGKALLETRGLGITAGGEKALVDNANLVIREGEIVGIAGVAGNGQTEFVEALTGLRRVTDGSIYFDGKDVTAMNVGEKRAQGLAYIPEDRSSTGTASKASAAENLNLGFQRRPPQSKGLLFDARAVAARAKNLIERFSIKIRDEATEVGTLSGGNLQKVVVAREMSHDAKVLIAEQPTRGVDVGAIEFIHSQIMAERIKGHGVLLVSAELWEIMSLSDRVHVMYEGRLLPAIDIADVTEAKLGLLMAGKDGLHE